MKKITLMCAALATVTVVHSQTTLPNSNIRQEWGGHNSNIVAVDVNNDGLRDLVFAGIGTYETNNAGLHNWEKRRMSHVVTINPKNKRWYMVGNTNQNLAYFNEGIGFNVADRPSLSACDINQDGIMDIVAFESTGRTYNDEPYLDNISREGIFLGNGDGTFVQFEPTFVDSKGFPAAFDLHAILSADVADFNNDGLTDIVGIGYQTNKSGIPTTYTDANVVLLNQGGGKFMVTHYLTDDYLADYGQEARKYHFECGQVQAYDFNNDGYVDFIVNSNSNDRKQLGTEDGDNNHFTDIFINDSRHPGQFKRMFAAGQQLPSMSQGDVVIADYNNDCIPDIFMSGWTGNDRQTYVYGVYTASIADDGSVAYTPAGTCGLSDMRGQNSTNRQYGAMDWNGDGNYDIFNMGWSPVLNTQTCLLGYGGGNADFEEKTRLGGGSEGSLTFVDWNGDGVNDYVAVAQTTDNSLFPGINSATDMFSATKNPNAKPDTPETPLNLMASTANGLLTVAWQQPATAKGNETYEYFVKSADGNLVAGGNSFIGGEKDGVRKVNMAGNAFNAKRVTLNLPDGSYIVGVQTVSAALLGSPFVTVDVKVEGSNSQAKQPMIKPEVSPVGEQYANPVLNTSVPDPTVLRADDGTYYMYGTEDIRNTPIYMSKNLVDWTFVGTAFTDATRPTMVPGGGLWAPDINKIGDKYVLYFSKSRWGGEWDCGIGCAVADKPEGPFLNAKKLFVSSEIGVQNSIDPFYIEDGGRKYLFWGSFRGIYAIELSDDGLSVKSGAEKVQIAGTLIEGTYIIKRDGYYYLFGSAGTCCDGANSSYHVVVARSKELLGPYVSKTGEKALENGFSNLLYRSPDVVGPGHNSELVTDDAGQQWMFYHGYDAKDIDGGRKVFLDKVTWDKDGWPMVENLRPSVKSERPVIDEATSITRPETEKADNGVRVTPRKVYDEMTITLDGENGFKWQVVNLHGQKVKAGKAVDSYVTVDMYDVPQGMYIVNVYGKNGTASEKIIKY